jgi:hypothetical protein
MTARPLSPTVRDRLAKLLPRLATPHDGQAHDGERVATVAAIERLLSKEGLDWHDLTGAFAAEQPTPSPAAPRARRAPVDPSDPLIGRRIDLDRRCRGHGGCGGQTAVVHPGRGPHAYALRCAQCGRHAGWLAKARAEALWREMENAP